MDTIDPDDLYEGASASNENESSNMACLCDQIATSYENFKDVYNF